MKTKVLALLAFGLLAAGCGRSYSGTYIGTQQILAPQGGVYQQSYPAGQALTVDRLQIQIPKEPENDWVQGTWTSNSLSGSFTAKATGDSLENMMLTVNTPTTTSNTTTTNVYSGNYAGMTFQGTLSFDGSHLSGTLSPLSQGSMVGQYSYQPSLKADATK